jgi:hypothetical protein
MKLPKKTEWVCPKGTHQARLTSASLRYEEGEDVLKIIAVLTSLRHPLKQYVVRLVYKAKDLHRFVEQFGVIIGEDAVSQLFNMEGELISDGLTVLDGLRIDIETDSYQGEGHKHPWTKVVRVAKFGVLTNELDEAAV